MELFWVRNSAHNAQAARARLRCLVDRVVALCAGVVSCAPIILAKVLMTRLDTLEPADGPPPDGHWAFCCQQMGMTLAQELMTRKLLDRYDAFTNELQQRRSHIILSYQRDHGQQHGQQQQPEGAPPAAAPSDQELQQWALQHGAGDPLAFVAPDYATAMSLLTDLERLQAEDAWKSAAFFVAFISGVLEPEQAASAMLGCYPYVLTLQGVKEGLGPLPE